MRITGYIFLVFVGILLLSRCKDEPGEYILLTDYNYFPIDTGNWIIYDVDSVVHLDIDDNTNQTDTSILVFHYQVKETIDSGFTDGEGEEAFRIVREKRDSINAPWSFINLWTCKRTYNSAQRVEDNLRYVKLAFPIGANKTWNGNAYNNRDAEEYYYEDIHQPVTYGTLTFDSSVVVVQEEFISLINRLIKKECYAYDVGLVFKQIDSLNVNGLGQVLNGIEFKQTVFDYRR